MRSKTDCADRMTSLSIRAYLAYWPGFMQPIQIIFRLLYTKMLIPSTRKRSCAIYDCKGTSCIRDVKAILAAMGIGMTIQGCSAAFRPQFEVTTSQDTLLGGGLGGGCDYHVPSSFRLESAGPRESCGECFRRNPNSQPARARIRLNPHRSHLRIVSRDSDGRVRGLFRCAQFVQRLQICLDTGHDDVGVDPAAAVEPPPRPALRRRGRARPPRRQGRDRFGGCSCCRSSFAGFGNPCIVSCRRPARKPRPSCRRGLRDGRAARRAPPRR